MLLNLQIGMEDKVTADESSRNQVTSERSIQQGTWHTMRIEIHNNFIRGFADGVQIADQPIVGKPPYFVGIRSTAKEQPKPR